MRSYLGEYESKWPQRNAGYNFSVWRMWSSNIFPWRSFEISDMEISLPRRRVTAQRQFVFFPLTKSCDLLIMPKITCKQIYMVTNLGILKFLIIIGNLTCGLLWASVKEVEFSKSNTEDSWGMMINDEVTWNFTVNENFYDNFVMKVHLKNLRMPKIVTM